MSHYLDKVYEVYKVAEPAAGAVCFVLYSFQAPGLAHQSASHKVFHKHAYEKSLLKDKASGHSI